VYTECKKPGQFVLTFDDGPNVGTTEKALNVLKKNGIIGTFFINSANYVDLLNSPEARNLVKQAFDEGHDIGSHTYQHKDLFIAMDENSMELNVDKNNEVINSIIGHTPVFFRPPLGNGGFTKEYCTSLNIPYDSRTEQVRQYLGDRGMKVIMWNADTQDWNNKGNVQNSINELAKSVNAPGKSPQNSSFITLIHDVHEYSVDVILQQVIDYVKQQGYQIVSLSECIGEPPY
ncbi:carbohydrate esterase family 4 protein, partial [Piromyces sp. E2]